MSIPIASPGPARQPGFAPSPGPAPLAGRWRILMAVLAASVMGPIDGSVINVALPVLRQVFHVSMGTVGWVSMAYMLVLGSLILTYGRLGDMFGFKRIFLAGVVTFTVSSAVCALSPNIWTLIAFRGIQAIGAGMFMAMAPAIIASVFPPYERGRALGINSMVIAVGLALGPSLGGFLLTVVGWQSIFLINVPIGLFALIYCIKVIPAPADLKPQRFDLSGAALGFVSLTSLLLVASYGEDWGWTSPVTLSLSAVFAVALWAFLIWERRAAQPMLDLTLFRSSAFSAANFSALMNFVAQSAALFLAPFYLQQILNYTPEHAGFILSASPLVVLVSAPISGAISDRIGTRWLSFAGQSLVAVAYLLLYWMPVKATGADIAWRLAVIGLGTGIFQTPNTSTVMGNVPRHRMGIGSGVLATVRNVGMVLGVAISTAVLTWQQSVWVGRLGEIGSFRAGLKAAFLVGAFLAAAGAAASSVRSDDWRKAT